MHGDYPPSPTISCWFAQVILSILDILKYESWYILFKFYTVGKPFQSHHFFEWIDPPWGLYSRHGLCECFQVPLETAEDWRFFLPVVWPSWGVLFNHWCGCRGWLGNFDIYICIYYVTIYTYTLLRKVCQVSYEDLPAGNVVGKIWLNKAMLNRMEQIRMQLTRVLLTRMTCHFAHFSHHIVLLWVRAISWKSLPPIKFRSILEKRANNQLKNDGYWPLIKPNISGSG